MRDLAVLLLMVGSAVLGYWMAPQTLPPPVQAQVYSSERGCYNQNLNPKGVAKAPVTVTTTAGGTVLWDYSGNRCDATIFNRGTVEMLCWFSTGLYAAPVTSTVGIPIGPSGSVSWGHDSQQEMRCLTASGSTTAIVVEGRP